MGNRLEYIGCVFGQNAETQRRPKTCAMQPKNIKCGGVFLGDMHGSELGKRLNERQPAGKEDGEETRRDETRY